MRILDQKLANKVRDGFGIHAAFSTSTLAAPAVAMAALDPCVCGSFFVGDDLMLNVELTVKAGSDLDGMTTPKLVDLGRFDYNPELTKLTDPSGTPLLVFEDYWADPTADRAQLVVPLKRTPQPGGES